MAVTQDLHLERHWICARRMTGRRHDLGLTQGEVVRRLYDLGVAASNRMLSAMEHGQGIDLGRVPELAKALDCTVTYLLGLTDDPHDWVPARTRARAADGNGADRARAAGAGIVDGRERLRA